jgi:hypothetical protein
MGLSTTAPCTSHFLPGFGDIQNGSKYRKYRTFRGIFRVQKTVLAFSFLESRVTSYIIKNLSCEF